MSQRKCFVIMPFGDKINVDTQLIGAIQVSVASGEPIDPRLIKPIDFDEVYTQIIQPAIDASRFDLGPLRCDEIKGAGSIHADMFQHIHDDDVVVVDISTLNANVFYELGIRHSLKPGVTVLIQHAGTVAPFNITGFRVISYDPGTNPKNAVSEIAEFIDQGLSDIGKNQSPVYLHLPDLQVRKQIRPIKQTRYIEYEVESAPHNRIGLITGNIQNIKGVDVWVNSENTNMQMARYHDQGVSGMIRWLGAEKKRTGRVKRDTIADELHDIMDGENEVDDGTVLPTSSGELNLSHGVKRVFHAAAVSGQVGRGYRPIADVSPCILGALQLMDDEEFKDEGLETILFPLMGTGKSGGRIDDAMMVMIDTCLSYLRNTPDSQIKAIYIIARVQQHLDTGIALLNETKGLRQVQSNTPA